MSIGVELSQSSTQRIFNPQCGKKVPCQDGSLCDLPSEACSETDNFEVI